MLLLFVLSRKIVDFKEHYWNFGKKDERASLFHLQVQKKNTFFNLEYTDGE